MSALEELRQALDEKTFNSFFAWYTQKETETTTTTTTITNDPLRYATLADVIRFCEENK